MFQSILDIVGAMVVTLVYIIIAVWCASSVYNFLFYKKKSKKKVGTSAGGVVLRKQDGVWHVAMETVVGSKTHTGWYLPKGHVEHGESVLTAAKREVEEEVGVLQEDLQKKDYLGYKERLSVVGNEWKVIHYFLFITSSTRTVQVLSNKKHVVQWVPLQEAVTPFDEQNEILDEARKVMVERGL
jgi:8-oxo-dGTP pyrophosphatase MutT (NUDIX family)